MRTLVPALTLTLLLGPPAASTSPAQDAAVENPLEELIPGAIAFHNDVSAHALAELGSGQIQDLIAGETVLVRRRTRTEDGRDLAWVYAYALSTQPRKHLWLAATRPGFSDGDVLRTVGVERHDDGRTATFMYLDVPWPMTDRWWLASVEMDVELAEASGGRVWARRWKLEEDGAARARMLAADGALGAFTVEILDEGLALPTNEGAYLNFDLDDRHTLIAYASLISAGGDVPDGFFTEFASLTLQANVTRILEEARAVPAAYVAGSPVCTDGFGRPLPFFPSGNPAAAAASNER